MVIQEAVQTQIMRTGAFVNIAELSHPGLWATSVVCHFSCMLLQARKDAALSSIQTLQAVRSKRVGGRWLINRLHSSVSV